MSIVNGNLVKISHQQLNVVKIIETIVTNNATNDKKIFIINLQFSNAVKCIEKWIVNLHKIQCNKVRISNTNFKSNCKICECINIIIKMNDSNYSMLNTANFEWIMYTKLCGKHLILFIDQNVNGLLFMAAYI